jgi:hypothetical protein
MRGDQFADQRHDARDDLVLAMVAVGKERVVGDIDIMRVKPCPTISRKIVSCQGRNRKQESPEVLYTGSLADLA